MKHLALVCMLAAMVLVPATARADWMENFDSYALGSALHGQGGWHGWDGDPTWTAYISDVQSHSTPHSVNITGSSDMVQEYSGYTSGTWFYTAWQYIPAEFSGTSYFILLNTYNNAGPYNWSTQVSFNSSTNTVQNDADLTTLPLIRGRWVEIRVEINLDTDIQTFTYDGQTLFASSWINGLSGGGAVNIGAVDLFANNASPIYYDDMSLLGDVPPVPVEVTSWGAVKGMFR